MQFLNYQVIQKSICFSVGIIASLFCQHISAADPGIELFETKIRPVLIKHCYECHSAASSEIKGEFQLDSRETIRKGGESGPAIIPFKPEESILIEALKHESFEMPPDKKLSDDQVNDFVKWIKLGAPDPRDKSLNEEEAAEESRKAIFEQRRKWWSLIPLKENQPPDIEENLWSDKPIDRFVLSKMQKSGLHPSSDANPSTLLRRLSFVLTGLPPDTKQVKKFTSEYTQNPELALTNLVDELLASPHYGERIARHWMDVVRYTDTYGYEWDTPAKGSWEYRDYLIRAFNNDVGYDQLVMEQLAGDLIPIPRMDSKNFTIESMIGPMFYHMGEHRHGDSLDFNGIHQEMINNKIDAFSKAFLANSVACARCHDHKLDAVWQRDYYAMAGVFMSARWTSRIIDAPAKNVEAIRKLKKLRSEIQLELKDQWVKQAQQFENELLEFIKAVPIDKAQQAEDTKNLISSKRILLWKKVFRKNAGKSPVEGSDQKPVLEKPLVHHLKYPVSHLLDVPDDQGIASAWKELAGEWRTINETHKTKNLKNFKVISDMSSPDLPAGWTIEGDGIKHGYVKNGTLLVALDGDGVIEKVLQRGYHTNALSSKLPGALRMPPELQIPGKSVSLKVAGKEWSGFLRIPDNAFQTENVIFFNNQKPKWRLFKDTALKNGVQRRTIEVTTSDLNPNFPPRNGKATAEGITLPENDFGFNKRSWFSLTGIVTHDHTEAPADELNHFESLYTVSGDDTVPQSKVEAFKRIAQWLTKPVLNWSEGKADSGDVIILNWLVSNHFLNNHTETGSRLSQLLDEYRRIEKEISFPRTVNGMDERDVKPINYPINIRGNVDETGPEIPRDFLEVFAGQNKVKQSAESGRLELAKFMVSPKHPLTARVYVNRIWQWVFGQGIVRTPNDFGHLGIKPTHPELLDYLAKKFIEEDWSTKRLIRQLVLTRTFRQSGMVSEKGHEVDPDNFFLHYYPTRRLEAEAIRDSLLAVSGQMDEKLYGHPIDPPRTKEDSAKRLFNGPADGDRRRSIYIKMSIMDPPKFLVGFNLPDLKLPTGKRDVTNVPTQALILLNNSFVAGQAEKWTDRLLKMNHETAHERINVMFVEVYGRSPREEELSRWTKMVQEFGENGEKNNLMDDRSAWYHVAHTFFNTKEFIYYR